MWKWLLLVMLTSGCAVAPVQEMSDARQAIQSAKNAGGEKYSADVLESAEVLLERAEHSLRAGRYDEARAQAVEAKRRAVAARDTESRED